MLPQQTPYTAPHNETESRPEVQYPPIASRPLAPEYNEQFIETLAQRLMPRLMPEILHQLRLVQPANLHYKAMGMSLALAIVSLALMIPMIAILVGSAILDTVGIVGVLIGVGVVCLAIVLVNLIFNYTLFNVKS